MKFVFCVVLAISALAAVPPAANQLFPQLVGGLGYPCEEHNITTSDGYINTYFRIQAKNTAIKSGLPVVYVQHGLLDSGDDWVVNDENLAPGFILANAGFDVWVGNTRGNRYSQASIYPNTTDPNGTYWDFSWQDMSMYDLPAAFDYIYGQTSQLINYIGHSQGTSIMFAALARRDPTILQYLKKFLAAGPVAYVDHASSPILDDLAKTPIAKWLYALNGKQFLLLSQGQYDLLEDNCEYLDFICIDSLHAISDFNTSVDNTARMDVFLGHFPAGTSVQNMYYWNQMVENTQFQMFNYGEAGNMQHYNQSTPPYYNLSQIDVPVHLFSGIYDELADPTDVAHLVASLTGAPQITHNVYPYGHATFFWGVNTSWINDAIAIINEASDELNIKY